MSRLTRFGQNSKLVTATFGLALLLSVAESSPHVAHADEPTEAESANPSELPEHLKALRERLGGSVVDQFDSLRPDSVAAPAWWRQFRGSLDANGGRPAPMGSFGTPTWGATWSGSTNATIGSEVVPAAAQAPVAAQPYAPQAYAPPAQAPGGPDPAHVITALREIAVRLDTAASRLERLELYSQADSLREQARELRVDARRRSAHRTAVAPTPGLPSTAPVPSWPSAPRYVPPTPMPTDTPRTSSSGSWRLNWVGPTDSGSGHSSTDDEPAIQPVWSEDRDSAGEFDPSTVPTPITPTPAQ
jgi:hypothetical protein